MAAAETEATAPEAAVILAAGAGSGSGPEDTTPPPLVKVLGLTLAERAVCTLLDAGVRRFLAVLGHQGERVGAHFSDIALRRGVTIEFVEAADWQLGSGASALAAKGRTGEAPFLVVMTDHLFDPGLAPTLAAKPPAPGEVCLAVDHDTDGILDLDDVTRVRIDDGRIAGIGKGLADWDAAGTGVMLCTSGLFEGLERAAAEGRHGLSDGLGELAREGRAGAVEVSGRQWLRVDGPAAVGEGERRLLRDCGGKITDGPVLRHLNRPLSGRLSRLLVRTPLTPNQISLFSWGLSCLAAGLFAAGGYPALAAGGVIAQVAMIVDGCDGEVARLKLSQTDFGGWFDAVLDRYADAFLLFGLTWHVFASSGAHLPLVVGFAALAGTFMNSYTADKYDGLMARKFPGVTYLRLGRDVRILIIFLGAFFNLPLLTLGVIAVVMNAEVVRRIVLCRRQGTA